MKPVFVATFISTLLGSALVGALPTSEDKIVTTPKVTYINFNKTDSSHEKRTAGGVYICTDVNWSGTCGYQVQPISDENNLQCVVLTSPWLNTISSFGPDAGAYAQLHSDQCCGCTCQSPSGCTAVVNSPGYADLRGIGWNDAIGSFYMFAA